MGDDDKYTFYFDTLEKTYFLLDSMDLKDGNPFYCCKVYYSKEKHEWTGLNISAEEMADIIYDINSGNRYLPVKTSTERSKLLLTCS